MFFMTIRINRFLLFRQKEHASKFQKGVSRLNSMQIFWKSNIKFNIPLLHCDIEALEKVLWSELGTKEEYRQEYVSKPLDEFVREIVVLDMNAAKATFSGYLESNNLDS